MSIKNIWRDSSFRKFLVGGVVLVALVGVGLNAFRLRTVPTDNQETQTNEIETSKPTETVQNDEDNTSIETEVSHSKTGSNLTENNDVLPQSGPTSFWLPLGFLSVFVYGLTYFLQKR